MRVAEVGDRVGGEELSADAPQRRLVGDRLGAVLAELRGVPVLRRGVGPGAALAVEAVDLVELAQGLGRTPDPHLLDRPLQAHRDRGGPGRVVLGAVDLQVVLVDVARGGLRLMSSSSLATVPRSTRPRNHP